MNTFIRMLMSTTLLLATYVAAVAQTAPAVAKAASISISEPRVRVPLNGRDQTAAYLTLTNSGTKADRLISASSPSAGKLELHAHLTTADGLMAMRQINQIDVPAGAQVPLTPGGLHIMVKQVKPGLKVGDTLAIMLIFASGQSVRFSAPIVANPSADMGKGKAQKSRHQH
jgi:periplasmic copper chaperone A